MTNKTLSRRDAIKIISATTGASLLANLPAKWSKPELKGSKIPAHAQTSEEGEPITCYSLLVEYLFVGTSGSQDYYYYGPNPQFSFTPGDNDNEAGDYVFFPCTTECLYFQVFTGTGGDLSVRFTVSDFNGNIVQQNTYNNIGEITSRTISAHYLAGTILFGGNIVDGCPALD